MTARGGWGERLGGLVLAVAAVCGLAAAPRAAPAAGRPLHATVAAASGHRPRRPEPTFALHGLRVPVGACGVVEGRRVLVLACDAPLVRAYRARLARRARARGLCVAAGAAAAGLVAGAAAVARRRRRAGGDRTWLLPGD